MPDPINKPTIAEALVHSNHRFKKECLAIIPASVEEVTAHMRVVNNLKGKETEATIVPQAHWRPYHSEKIVGGTAGLTARTLETFPLEILEEFDPEDLYTTCFDQPFDAAKDQLAIVRKMLQEEMVNASRGLCDLIFRGVRKAIGTGALDGFNGFDTIISNEITAGNISFDNGNFITLGEVDESNIGDRWKLMYRKINETLRGGAKKQLKLICSYTEYDMYKNWYAARFGQGNFAGTPEQTFLDGTANKVQIVPLPGMDGTAHCFITVQENMKVGFDVFSKHTKFDVRIPDNPNVVQMHAKIYMGVDFANIEKEFLFVAARTVVDDSVYMVTDKEKIEFDDTVLTQSDTATINLQGFNMTAATDLSIEGTDKTMFSLSANTVSAADANAEGGADITVTFTPTTSAGEKTAQLRISNATDNVSIVVPLSGEGKTE